MPTAGSRYNRAPDADAIAHGMSNRVGAGPTPTAWRCTAASGQGEQLCQKYPKMGCRNNRAQDADASAHGMRNRMGAGPAPAAWRGAPASGQGRQLYQKRHIDIIVLGMQMQLRMGCATGWGQRATTRGCKIGTLFQQFSVFSLSAPGKGAAREGHRRGLTWDGARSFTLNVPHWEVDDDTQH